MTPCNIQYRWTNGETVLVQAQPNHSDPAKATGWIGSVIDVTAQAKAEQEVLATEDLEALDAIAECAMAQERIANDILGLAQLQLKRYNITPVAFDLLASLRNTCRMFKNECKAKSIDLSLVFGSSLTRLGPHARVHADPTRLAQM
ncbi:hypothetical protein RQP46_002000 [Phenoliferia psychrophenolica]